MFFRFTIFFQPLVSQDILRNCCLYFTKSIDKNYISYQYSAQFLHFTKYLQTKFSSY